LGDSWTITLGNNEKLEADAILLATGFDLFETRKKEELTSSFFRCSSGAIGYVTIL
jgi:heterodisulfide reductase subunit A-like polyferredoxin